MRAPKRFIVLFDEGFGDAHVLPIVCVRKNNRNAYRCTFMKGA